jgi:hypothetical protein
MLNRNINVQYKTQSKKKWQRNFNIEHSSYLTTTISQKKSSREDELGYEYKNTSLHRLNKRRER